MEQRVALLGGSFNPVHVGHLMLAQYVASWGLADSVWLNLSPQNPLKDAEGLADDSQRLAMLRIAARTASERVEVCDVELSMPRPSYTIDTLRLLESRYPDKKFTLLVGADNWAVFDRWRSADEIIRRYGVIVYPRPGYSLPLEAPENVKFIAPPTIDLSSTFLRGAIAEGRDVNFLLPPGVYSYIKSHNLYGYQPKP